MNIETQSILNKVRELKNKYTFPQDKERAEEWEKYILQISENKELLEVEAIKKLLEGLKNTINEISYLLAWDRESQDKEKRLILFEKRDAYLFFLEFFTGKEEILKGIADAVNKELEN